MKKIFFLALNILLLFSISIHSNAQNLSLNISPSWNGEYYTEDFITDSPSFMKNYLLMLNSSVTKTKTKNFRDSNGNILWSVSITATFTYDGNTSECISCSHQTTVNATYWSIISSSDSKSGNSATATAVARHTSPLGFSNEYTQSVTIQCTPDGEVY